MEHRARALAYVTGPAGTTTVTLDETGPGLFTGTLPTPLPGTYHLRVVADGLTMRGGSFTREHLLTAVCIRGGDRPSTPVRTDDGDRSHELCDLVDCLTSVGAKFLERNEISPEELRRCVHEHCKH